MVTIYILALLLGQIVTHGGILVIDTHTHTAAGKKEKFIYFKVTWLYIVHEPGNGPYMVPTSQEHVMKRTLGDLCWLAAELQQ